MTALERRIQAAMLASAVQFRDVARIGPFTATFARESANPFLSYAIPDENAVPSADDVAALVCAYRERGRVPRLEYLPTLAPAVEPALVDSGFALEARAPLMVLRTLAAASPPSGVELVEADSEQDVRAAAAAQHEAYGEPDEPTDGWVEGVLRSIAAGGLLVLARDAQTQEAAGGGQCTPPQAGASELAAIGVRPAFRRRGIAAAMTSWLAARMRGRGADLVYLTAAGETEAGIYARVGFERVGAASYVSLPARRPPRSAGR
jgi:ribosomal protein S18 acetylase RimI-like enzyme